MNNEEAIIKSKTLDLKPKFKLANIIAGCLSTFLLFLLFVVILLSEYNKYKEIQDAAITFTKESASPYYTFDDIDDRKELLDEMESLYDEIGRKYLYVFLDNYIEMRGYDSSAYIGQRYIFDCPNYLSFVFHVNNWHFYYSNASGYGTYYGRVAMIIVPLLIWAVVGIAYFFYNRSKKAEITVNEKVVVCKKPNNSYVRVPIRDIQNVELSKLSGIKIQGIGIKYSAYFIANGAGIKREINKLLEEKNTEKQQLTSVSNTDELMKYKELFDNGVITQEEFDKKKKELLRI